MENTILHFSNINLSDIKNKINNCYNIEILSFSGAKMNSSNFDNVTESVSLQNLKILDLSYNCLDQSIAPPLIKWMNDNMYVDITHNPIDVKNVAKLHFEFSKYNSPEKFMKQIIFIPKNYLRTAKRSQIYKNLVDNKIIPGNWYAIHEEYSNLNIKKKLELIKDLKSYNDCMHKMNLMLLLSD